VPGPNTGVIDTSARAASRALADVSITPVFGPGTWRHVDCGGLFLAAGRQAAERALGRLAMVARPTAALDGVGSID